MPSASVLRRAWRRPAKTYANGFDRIGVGGGFRPGLVFDLYDPAGNRLGWGRVTGLGDIELFDAASNRLGSIQPTYRAFVGNGQKVRTHAVPIEPLKKGEVLEIGPEGKRGVWRTIGANPIFIEVSKGESVPEAVRRAEAGGREVQQRITKPAAILGVGKSKTSEQLTKKFGPYSPKADAGVLAKLEAENEAGWTAFAAEANELDGILEAESPAEIIKVWKKRYRQLAKIFFDVRGRLPKNVEEVPGTLLPTRTEPTKEEAARFLSDAGRQIEDWVDYTQWKLRAPGRFDTKPVTHITMYRGYSGGKDTPKGDGSPSNHRISYWTTSLHTATGFVKRGGSVYEAKVPIEAVLASWETLSSLNEETQEHMIDRGWKLTRANSRRLSAGEIRSAREMMSGGVLSDLYPFGVEVRGIGPVEFPIGRTKAELGRHVGTWMGLMSLGLSDDLAAVAALRIDGGEDPFRTGKQKTPNERGAPMTDTFDG